MRRMDAAMISRLGTGVIGFLVLLTASRPEAAPVSVKLSEGSVRGFVVVRSLDGHAIAYGEMLQHPKEGALESRLLLNFDDGSVYDETVTFSQAQVFTVQAYRLRQHGPSFPTSEISFDRKTRRFQARVQEKKGAAEQTASGDLEMPPDLYNGMTLVLIKNLRPGETADVKMAAFMPKPRLITMHLQPEGEESALLGAHPKKVIRYVVKLEIGGLTGALASLLGKQPADLHYWFVPGDLPAFAKFEGPMFLNGPIWRLELATLGWRTKDPGR